MVNKIAAPPLPPADYVPVSVKLPAPPAPPPGYDPNTGEVHPTRPRIQSIVSNSAVKEMQDAIIDLYNTFQYYPMFNVSPSYREGTTKEYEETYEHGADPFLTFLLNRYINKSPIVGQEVPKNTTPEAKPENLIKLIDSLKNIGTQTDLSAASVPDGRWGNKTTNALKNVYAITSAMLNLMKNLKIESSNYNEGLLEQLKDLISKPSSSAAITITKNIADIKKLIGDFMANVNREKGKFSAYVRQEKPFETKFGDKVVGYDKKDNDVFMEMSKSAPIVLFNIPQDITTGQGEIPLNVAALVSRQNFDEFLKSNNIVVNGKDPIRDSSARNELLDYIENQIKSMNVAKPSDEKLTREVPF